MNIEKPSQILSLRIGSKISKRNLYEVIMKSKVADSQFWDGEDNKIGNTPQQGINWIGKLPHLKGVIIKTRHGAHKEDGWENTEKTSYRYSFKHKLGIVHFSEKANDVLIKQPEYGYPILLFVEEDKYWKYEGSFLIREIGENSVSLEKYDSDASVTEISQDEINRKMDPLEKRIAILENEIVSLKNAINNVRNENADLSNLIENSIPNTGLLSNNFFRRAFTVWWNYFIAQFIIVLILLIPYLILAIFILKSISFTNP
jgi:hypothetical protein